jgi:hypothetical protein
MIFLMDRRMSPRITVETMIRSEMNKLPAMPEAMGEFG